MHILCCLPNSGKNVAGVNNKASDRVYGDGLCEGMTPLMHAVKNGELSTVKELMNLDAHLNHVDDKKWSAMHYAACVRCPCDLQTIRIGHHDHAVQYSSTSLA